MKFPWLKSLAAAAVAALALTGCTVGESSEKLDNGDEKVVDVAVFAGWDEGVAASHLWKTVLEEKGYTVNLHEADPAAVYTGLANGDYDVVLDTWLPITHASYIEKYGDKIIDLGAWNDEAKLTIAVNEDAPIDSLEELAANADKFGNKIYGIEAGAGLTKVTEEEVIPQYGLDKMEYAISSTPAMLTELKAKTKAGENVVVTLWRPHWAYDEFPIKDLEDPKGALGGAESIHSYAAGDFETTHPQLAGWLKGFKMDSETLYSLENVMFNENESEDYAPVVKDWIAENQEYVDGLTK
ncbi:glycine betaine ABC transporter substrate-binding protein [Gulosibacter bifidus]|uniref:Glycine betaine ABC transporter substrate-binding protein n=1 Tax=Gulosibacter bifidus TaxID=272239 RepID=A0ABW5RJ08_9MICO|nr:glycine betaine ABC transporter substrate-binding protein [Gulosibacter bifidus]